MTAQILKFPERKTRELPPSSGYGRGGASSQPSPVSEYDCNMLDYIKATADRALDVTKIEKKALESFLHDGLKLGTEFQFGQHKLRLTFQVEDLTPPKTYA